MGDRSVPRPVAGPRALPGPTSASSVRAFTAAHVRPGTVLLLVLRHRPAAYRCPFGDPMHAHPTLLAFLKRCAKMRLQTGLLATHLNRKAETIAPACNANTHHPEQYVTAAFSAASAALSMLSFLAVTRTSRVVPKTWLSYLQQRHLSLYLYRSPERSKCTRQGHVTRGVKRTPATAHQ